MNIFKDTMLEMTLETNLKEADRRIVKDIVNAFHYRIYTS